MSLANHIPQLIYVGVMLVGLGISIAQHGDKEEGTENAWTTAGSTAVILFLLWWGGFFK